ncbi:alpha/beta fold hydrolase [Acidobacteriota bacterium]
MKKWIITLSLAVFLLGLTLFGADDFSKEKAFEHIKHMAGTIGPRPMGSPHEMEALAYAADKFAEFGCQVEWQYISQSKSLNTNSGNVFGRLPGESAREIVIGAHIDSASPEIPGANDDASGVAALIELARVYSQRSHYSTLVFVAFGGEESGLVGSRHFVEHYPLDNVALMLQLDMTSNDSPLTIWVDTKEHQTPRWLVSASIDAFHSLGYRDIDYPTHFQSPNSAMDGAGSDHQPFMEKGIPAIAFVSDVSAPIHTRHDTPENFEIDGLERSGKLIMALIDKFDRDQPEQNKDHYMLVLLNEKPVYISPQLMVIFLISSFILAIIALIVVRKRRDGFAEEKKIKKSWPKLSVLLFILLVVMSLADGIMRLLKGQRFFWYAHPVQHLYLIIPFALLGIWLALQLLGRWTLRRDAFFYLIRATVYLSVFIAFLWIFTGPRMAIYPASALFLISLACLLPWTWLKGILWVLSLYLPLRVLFIPEYPEFVYRGIAPMFLQSFKTGIASFIFSVALVMVMFIWVMPHMLGFAAVRYSTSRDLFWLKGFRKKAVVFLIALAIVGGAAYLMTLPSYTSIWEQEVNVYQRYDGEKDKTFIQFSSGDYLKGIEASIAGKQEILNSRKCVKDIDYPLELDWIRDRVTLQAEKEGSEQVVDMDILIEFEKQPYTVTLEVKADQPFTVEECNVKYQKSIADRATLSWYSFPPLSLQPRLKLKIPKEAELKVEITASFLETPVPITCEGEKKHFIHRAIIKREIDLGDVGQSGKLFHPVEDAMVDVGDHRLHARVFGKGSPAVVLISGFGAPQTYWDNIVPALAAKTTVVTFDRAGYGQSEMGQQPCTGGQTVRELKALLEGLKLPDSYIMVGHSYGVKIARLFAADYPESTKGIVLIDGAHEDWVEDFRAVMTESERQQFDDMRASFPGGDLPGGRGCEMAALETTIQQLREIDATLDVPLLVLTAKDRELSPFHKSLSEETLKKFHLLKLENPEKHLRLSTKGKHVIVKNSGHNVHTDRPLVVIDSILSLVE